MPERDFEKISASSLYSLVLMLARLYEIQPGDVLRTYADVSDLEELNLNRKQALKKA